MSPTIALPSLYKAVSACAHKSSSLVGSSDLTGNLHRSPPCSSSSLCRKLAVPRKANISVTAASITITTFGFRCISHWRDSMRSITVPFPFQETGGSQYQFHACTSAMRSHGRQPSVPCADSSLGPLASDHAVCTFLCHAGEGLRVASKLDHREARREETRVRGFATKNRCLIFPTCGNKQKIITIIDELRQRKNRGPLLVVCKKRLCDKDVATRTSRTRRHGTKPSIHLSPLRGS